MEMSKLIRILSAEADSDGGEKQQHAGPLTLPPMLFR